MVAQCTAASGGGFGVACCRSSPNLATGSGFWRLCHGAAYTWSTLNSRHLGSPPLLLHVWLVAIWLVIGAGLLGNAPAAMAAQGATPATNVPLAPPESISAAAVFALDTDSGVALLARNADQRRSPASTTKIATALVVMRHAERDERVVIVESDLVDITIFSHMGLFVGDTLTVDQLLYGALLPSGSDAARALARYVGNKLDPAATSAEAAQARFVAEMNTLVADLGLANSQFANPEGNDDPAQYISARDLALLARELLRDPVLATIVETREWSGVSVGPEQRPYTVRTTNSLLGEEGVHGVKTGTTPDAGGCLVAARFIDDHRVVVVVLGSDTPVIDQTSGDILADQRFDDTRAIFAEVRAAFRWLAPAEAGAVPGLLDELAAWGVTLQEPPAIPIPAGAEAGFRYKLVLAAEGPERAEAGRVLFFIDSVRIGEVPVYQVAVDPAGSRDAALGVYAPAA